MVSYRTSGKQNSAVFTVTATCEWEQLTLARWLQPLPREVAATGARRLSGLRPSFLVSSGCVSPHAQAYPAAYLLELSFHAASCTRTAGDKGGPWPSTVLTVLE